jgi:hypothetical protein
MRGLIIIFAVLGGLFLGSAAWSVSRACLGDGQYEWNLGGFSLTANCEVTK